MHKRRFATRIISLAIVILEYAIVTSTAPAAAASMEQSPNTLHEAAKAGKIADVKSFISAGADVNAKDQDGQTPLYYAIQRGHREIAELLLTEQIRPLSGDLARIALARKRLQQLTNHATPFEKKLLDIEELLVHLMVKDLLPVREWEKLKGLKIKEILNGLDEQNKAYFEANPESQYDGTEMMILSLLKNAINEFLEAGRILDESDAAYDDDALFSKVLYVLSKRQETAAQHIFARLIKNLADRQEKTAELESKVASIEARLHKERHEFSKMGRNDYKIFTSTDSISINRDLNINGVSINNVCIEGDVNNDGFNDILISNPFWNNNTGRALFFYGGKDIDFSSPDMIFEGEIKGDFFGNHAGVFADINNDGYDDVIIGATGHYWDPFDGRVCVFYGGANIDTQADIIFEGETGKKGRFGLALDVSDIDGDGFNDLIVGAQAYDNRRGRAYLFWGAETMNTTADFIFEGEAFPEEESSFNPRLGWQGNHFGRKVDASTISTNRVTCRHVLL